MIEAGTLQAVIFDLDDTLRFNHPHAHDFFADFAASQGLSIDEEARHNAFRWAHSYWATSETLLEDLHKHNGYEDAFWMNFTRRHLASLGGSPEEIEKFTPIVHEHMRDHYKPESRLAPGTHDVLDRLRARGLMVGLLTNRTKPVYEELLDLDLDIHLDFFFTAGQVGAFKPHKELFERVLNLIQVSPEKAIYVGDNYISDIIGAQKANLQPVLLDPRGLYPDADCPVIESLSDLFTIIEGEKEANV